MKTAKKILIQCITVSALSAFLLIAGCDVGAHQENVARNRLERKIYEARILAAKRLISEGKLDHAQKIIENQLVQANQIHPEAVSSAIFSKQDKPQFVEAHNPVSDEITQTW